MEAIIKEHMENGESMSDLASKMPTLMDRAKLNVFVSYTLLSLVHSTLRVSDPHSVTQPAGMPSHPVRTELERIKTYFEKIEHGTRLPKQRKTKVDAAAADRFIKSAIAPAPKHTRFDDDTPEPKRKKQK